MSVGKIWITIEGKTMEVIKKKGIVDFLKDRHPEKEFVEIERIWGDIGELVELAIETYIDEIYRSAEKHLKLRQKLAEKNIADKYKEMIEFCKERLEELEKEKNNEERDMDSD